MTVFDNAISKRSLVFSSIFLFVLCVTPGLDSVLAGGISKKAAEGTNLQVLLKTGYESGGVKEFVEEFEQQTGIDVQYEIYDESTMHQKFVLDSSQRAGSYDVVATQFWYMPEYINAKWLQPLDRYVKRKKVKDWFSHGQIPEGLVDTYRSRQGSLYAVPVSASGGVLIYRKDLFEKYDIRPPKTTGDVLEAARKLEKVLPEDVYPFVGRGDASAASFGSSVGWAWAYGARVLDDQGNVRVDTPEMHEAISDWVQLLRQYGPPDASSMNWQSMSETFRQGNAAMNFDMSGFPSVYANPETSQVADKIGVTLIKGPADHYAQWMYGEGLGISKFSDNKTGAWLFLQWRASQQVAKREVKAGLRYDFPIQSIYDLPLYRRKTQDIRFFARKIPDIMRSVNTDFWPNVENFNQVAENFQKSISAAIAGDLTVEQALSRAQSDVDGVIE